MSRMRKHLFRKGQTGQTIVLLAIGFIVLLAFVGIVTDVSLMFVRYSSLRRAVDAAAVAAAGQVRRILPTAAETSKAQSKGGTAQEISDRAAGYAFARSYATVSLAARQFIELYGLNPTIVTVDTCYTLKAPPYDKELNCDPSAPNWKPQKLVRVTAQVPSPTIFLRLIGWRDITLEASAVSQTASLDVVMIFDVSEVMAAQTTYKDWSKIPNPSGGASIDKSMRFLAPRMVFNPNPAILATEDYNDFWQSVLNLKQADLDITPRFQPKAFAADNTPGAAPSITNANPAANDPRMPRSDCRVKFFPSSLKYAIPNGTPPDFVVDDNLRGEYFKLTGAPEYNGFIQFDGFRPTYNFYGCCNEPLDVELAGLRRSQVDPATDNFIFSSLVCQPFQKVREATKGFLDHVDFVRGDRVAFATYDRGATLIKPEATTADPQPQAMITSQTAAFNILNKAVGVHAEPFFYADTNGDNLWDAFVVGGTQYENCSTYTGQDKADCLDRHDATKGRETMTMTWDKTGIISATNPSGKPNTPGGFNGTRLGDMKDYAAKDDCFLQNATLEYPFSLWSAPKASVATDPTTTWMDYRWPSALSAKGKDAAGNDSIMHPNLNAAAWENQMPPSVKPNPALDSWKKNQLGKVKWNYEYRAGCRGGNVGAALRIGNNALVDPKTVRTDGSVWVMVLLGQGTAGASDPVRRGGAVPNVADPYGSGGYKGRPTAGEYGGYGVCPYGLPLAQSELVAGWDAYPPFCADEQPHSRHFCPFDPSKRDPNGSIYIDLGAKGSECELKYDVDDFARDWADWVGLVDPIPTNPNVLPRNGIQLPTIFTIGFGYSFPAGFSCGTSNNDPNNSKCLGEELLRYIADVGDNNRVDTDYEQDYRDNYNLDLSLPADQWGPNSPCEKQQVVGNNGVTYGKAADLQKAFQTGLNVSPDNLIRPIDAGLSCGNYFSAPAPDQLQPIFDEIASRMFTRISR